MRPLRHLWAGPSLPIGSQGSVHEWRILLLLLDVIVIFILLSASVVERRRLCRLLQVRTFRSVSPLHGEDDFDWIAPEIDR